MSDEPSPLDPMPVCLGCWRRRFGYEEDVPPPPHTWPMERCALCDARTNHGLYMLRGEAKE
jgi:hypothetical protein